MTTQKALAVAALLLTGAVVRIEIRKAGRDDPDEWWLGHLETRVSKKTCRCTDRWIDPKCWPTVIGDPPRCQVQP